jgi:hypothetical protein
VVIAMVSLSIQPSASCYPGKWSHEHRASL